MSSSNNYASDLLYSCYLCGQNVPEARLDSRAIASDGNAAVTVCQTHSQYPLVNLDTSTVIPTRQEAARLFVLLSQKLEDKGYDGRYGIENRLKKGVIIPQIGLVQIEPKLSNTWKRVVMKPFYMRRCPRCGRPGSGPHRRKVGFGRTASYWAHYNGRGESLYARKDSKEGSRRSYTKVKWCYIETETETEKE